MGDILRGTQIISDGPIAPGGTPSAPRISRTAPATIFRPHHRKPMGVIKVYHDNQRTFDFVAVRSDAFTIGRQEKNDLAICEDFRMSGQHARIERREVNGRTQFYLVDQNSTNGTFVRADRARLKDGDEILLGAERYQIMIGAEVRLKHIVPTRDGAELLLTGERWLGREFDDGLEAFKSDPMLDPRHARLFQDKSGRWVIQDGKSVNGTWVRVMEVPLLSRCNFQLGEQRFGFLD